MEPSLDVIGEIPTSWELRISEVTKLFKIEAHVIRHWEDEFSYFKPNRSKANHRVFTKRDLEILWCIKFLVNEKQFMLAGADSILTDFVKSGLTPKDLKDRFDHLFTAKKEVASQSNSSTSPEEIALLHSQIKDYAQKESNFKDILYQKDAQIKENQSTIAHLNKQLDESKANAIEIHEQKILNEKLQEEIAAKDEKIRLLEDRQRDATATPSSDFSNQQTLNSLISLEAELRELSIQFQSQ